MNSIRFPYLFLVITPLFFACRGPAAQENKGEALVGTVSSQPVGSERYVVDNKQSVVTWNGSMQLVPSQGHTGYVYVSKGELLFAKDQLVSGTVEMDMNTIADKDHGSENNLVWHLKDPDFFDVKKFPFSTFIITMVTSTGGENVSVTGNLTIKGITHAITFPAKIEIKEGVVNANGNVSIDRTKWEVNYKSGKLFANLANEAISDNIELQMKIVARK